MSRPFTITTPATSIELDATRTAEVVYAVFNVSSRRLVGRALIHIPEGNDATSQSWFTIQDEIERVFPEDGTQHFTVTITVPPEVPAGSYLFRFDMVGVEDVNELHVAGSSVAVQVGEPPPPPPRCRWCIPVAVAVVLLIGAGIAAYFLWPDNDEVTIPEVSNLTPVQATAQLTGACEPDPCFSVITENGLSDSVQHGLVIESSPAEGTSANRGDEVTLIVSAIEIPDIRNLSQNEALARLTNACTPSPCFSVIGIPVSTLLPIRLTGTQPPAGTLAQHGTEVMVNWTTDFGNPQIPTITAPDLVAPELEVNQPTPTTGQ